MKNKKINILITIILVGLIGFIDYITGKEIAFSLFYLLPVAYITWYNNKLHGIIISILSAVIWSYADIAGGNTFSHPLIPYWNAIVRLSFFLIVTLLLSTLKNLYNFEKNISRIDHLTGIANGRSFYEEAEKEINISRRYNNTLSIIYIDLDNFKEVNDEFGHLAGDDLLRTVGQSIKKNLRNTDTIARMGGDEFAVLLPRIDYNQSKIVTENIHSILSAAMKSNSWPITFSIGVASFIKPPQNVDEMIKIADDLMYNVKSNGKNSIKSQVFL